MTREEAIKEIEKAFEPAFANYIITALTESATVSDKPYKTMIEIDLYSIIKQKYIEREVLDKIRAEIENHCGLVKEDHCKYCSYCNSVMGVREILEILDKYKAENEVEHE